MRAVIQRVTEARVTVAGEIVGQIGAGLCVLIGVGLSDGDADASLLAEKVARLRVFEDAAGKMNLSLLEVSGELLAVSQFTLFADTSKGRRPSFIGAMPPERAEQLFERFCDVCRQLGLRVATGQFRTHMSVALVNDGPVTLWLDTEKAP